MAGELVTATSSEIYTPSELLKSWGFGPEEISIHVKELESPQRPHNSVIDTGTMALDCKQGGNFSNEPHMGSITLIGPDNKIVETGVIFAEPSLDVLRNHRKFLK